jgi:hypothetical protein
VTKATDLYCEDCQSNIDAMQDDCPQSQWE